MPHKTERWTEPHVVITVKEAAFAAGVSVKAVNEAIDRDRIQTRRLGRRDDTAERGIGGAEAVYLMVSQVLAPEIRRKVYRSFRGKALAELPRRLEMDGVVLEIDRVIRPLRSACASSPPCTSV